MLFQLRVFKNNEAPKKIQIEALTELEARTQIEKDGYIVLNIRPYKPFFYSQNKSFPLISFCDELKILLSAGLQLQEALEALVEKELDEFNKNIILKLVNSINSGKSFSDSLSNMKDIFPLMFIAIIKASETTGNLPATLSRYAKHLQEIENIKKKILSALIYPSIILFFGFLVIIFLVGFVVPRFGKIYGTQLEKLSLSTQALLSVGNFFSHYGLFVLILVISLILLTSKKYFQKSDISRFFINALSAFKPFRIKIRIYYLTQLYRTLSMLLDGGLSISKSLQMSIDPSLVDMHDDLNVVQKKISEGKKVSEAFQSCNLTTSISQRLIAVGEKTGSLAIMLDNAAAFHEKELLVSIDSFVKLLEPILMAFLGLIIGLVVILLYMPIFDLAGQIQ